MKTLRLTCENTVCSGASNGTSQSETVCVSWRVERLKVGTMPSQTDTLLLLSMKGPSSPHYEVRDDAC